MKTENWIHGWLKSIWKKAVWENPTIKKKEEWKGPGNPLPDGTYSEAEAADYYIGNKKESNMSSEVLTEFDDIIEVVLEHEGGYLRRVLRGGCRRFFLRRFVLRAPIVLKIEYVVAER